MSGGERPSPSREASPGGGAPGDAIARDGGAKGDAIAPDGGAKGDALAADGGVSGEGVAPDGGAEPKRERKKGKRKGGAKRKASAKAERDVDGQAGDDGGDDEGGAGDEDDEDEGGAGDAGGEEGGQDEGKRKRKPMGVGPGRRFAWSDVESGATFAGLAALFGLIAAGATQNSQWPAAPFVLLFYLALLGAAVGTYAARRAEPGTRDWFSTLARRVLWGFVGILALWFWLPPSQNMYFWLYRHLSVYLLSM